MANQISAARFVGDNTADNQISSANVVSNIDGSLLERFEAIQQGLRVGDEFWVKKTLVSSAILQAGVDVTAVSTVADLAIEDVILKTDATGLAAGTNFTLETNNAKGALVFLSTVVSGLNGSKTVEMSAATVSKSKTIMEVGKKIVAKMTVADGTGAGTVDVWIKFRRIAQNAGVAAA